MNDQTLWERGGLVEVLNSQDANYIHIAGLLLEENGMFFRVENELTNVIPGMSIGVSLMVRKEDAEKAIKILEDGAIIPNQSDDPEKQRLTMDETRKDEEKKIYKLILLLLLLLLLFWLWVSYLKGSI